MLGAARWTTSCLTQAEAHLVPLAIRVQETVACRVAKTLHRSEEFMARNRAGAGSCRSGGT